MVADGFSELQTRLDVTEQIKSFESKFQKLEEAAHQAGSAKVVRGQARPRRLPLAKINDKGGRFPYPAPARSQETGRCANANRAFIADCNNSQLTGSPDGGVE